MALILHRLVYQDIRSVLHYYEVHGGPALADRFFAELEALVIEVARGPHRYHPINSGLRRANLPTFPYHLLFRPTPSGVRVLVLRHHRRHPSFGLDRK